MCGLCRKRGIACAYKTDLNIIFVDPGRKANRQEFESDSETSSVEHNQPTSSPVDLPLSYFNSYFQLQLRGCLLEEYFPSATGRKSSSIAWLADAETLSTSDPLVNNAFDALAYSNLERRAISQNGNSTARSRMLYGKTLKRLRHRIHNSDDALGDATLATVMLLAAYEVWTYF